MMLQKRLKGSRDVGRTDGCADAENIAAKGLGSKTGPWVCGEIERSDRGFEGNRRGQVTNFWMTNAV